MKKKSMILGALCAFGAFGALAAVGLQAQAGHCESGYSTTWTTTTRCSGLDSGNGYGRGTGTPGTNSARVQVDLQAELNPPGPITLGFVYGFTSGNTLISDCAAFDSNPQSGTVEQTPTTGKCNSCTKFKYYTSW